MKIEIKFIVDISEIEALYVIESVMDRIKNLTKEGVIKEIKSAITQASINGYDWFDENEFERIEYYLETRHEKNCDVFNKSELDKAYTILKSLFKEELS